MADTIAVQADDFAIKNRVVDIQLGERLARPGMDEVPEVFRETCLDHRFRGDLAHTG